MRRLLPAAVVAFAVILLVAPGAMGRTGPVELGAAVNDHPLVTAQSEYLETLDNYDVLVPESAMNIFSLQPQEGRWDFSTADRHVEHAQRRGKRSHVVPLIWCTNDYMPRWVVDKAWTRDTMRAWITDYVTTIVRRYRGRVQSYDVINELFAGDGTLRDCVWTRVLGTEYVEIALKAARGADPDAKLFYNEYLAENPRGRKFLAAERYAGELRRRGVPLDGIGLQFHVFGLGPFQWDIEEAFRRIEALGMAVEVSEMDVPMNFLPGPTPEDKLRQQAETYGTVAAACRRVSACERVTTWGFTDRYSFRGLENASLPFDADYSPKPAWRALQRELRAPAPSLTNRLPSAPGRPSTAGVTIRGAFTLSWPAATDADGEPLTYVLEHLDGDDTTFVPVASVVQRPGFSFATGRSEAQGTWRYRVRAQDVATEGPWSAELAEVKVDRTQPARPVLTPDRPPEDLEGGWHRDRVTVSAVDGGDPALPDGSSGSGTDPATLPAPVSFSTDGEHTASAGVVDRAGNRSQQASATVRVDVGEPTVELRCPESATAGQPANATWAARDEQSGLAGAASGTVALDTATAGPSRAAIEIRDRVGHVASESCTVVVAPGPGSRSEPDRALPVETTAASGVAPAPPAAPSPAPGPEVTPRAPAETRPRVLLADRRGRVGVAVFCPRGRATSCVVRVRMDFGRAGDASATARVAPGRQGIVRVLLPRVVRLRMALGVSAEATARVPGRPDAPVVVRRPRR